MTTVTDSGDAIRTGRLSRHGIVILVLLIATVGYAVWFERHVPKGAAPVSSIELSFTPGAFSEAVSGWVATSDATRTQWTVDGSLLRGFRWRGIGSDFVFIVLYVGLLLLLYRRLEATAGRSPLLIPQLAISVAGLLDVFENIGILSLTWSLADREALSPSLFPAVLVQATSMVSALKWAALALAGAFIIRALFSGERRQVLVLCRYSLISIALGTVPLVATAQGRDLLSALAETDGVAHRAFFLATLAIWGLSVWYWSRVLLDAVLPADPTQPYIGLPRHLPRLLGGITLLAPAVPLYFADVPGFAKLLLVGGCVSLTVLFGVFVFWRHRWFSGAGSTAPIAFNTRCLTATAPFRVAAISATVSLSVFSAFVWASVPSGGAVGALGILFIAAANTVFFGSLAVFFSRRTGIALEAVALVCAAAFSFWNDNHDTYVAAQQREVPTLETVFATWVNELKARPHRHDEPATRPVFLIAAEGGGIRAAYWTATVLGALDDAAPDEFPYHVFSINGISGGSLGAAVYARLRQDRPQAPMRHAATSVLKDGYLAPVLARLVTGDLLQWFLPVPVHAFDRSTALEQAFANSYKEHVPEDGFTHPFLEIVPSATAGVPALILAGTNVDTGGRVLTASFSWTPGEFPDAIDYHRETSGDPTLVAAVHNSARFTYVSPAGLIRDINLADKGHVIDGGYFDPPGLETLFDLQTALTPLAAANGVRLVPIFITNSFHASGVQALGELPGQPTVTPEGTSKTVPIGSGMPASEATSRPMEVLGELFAPVRGLVRSRNAHARTMEGRSNVRSPLITFGFAPGATAATGTAKRLEPPLGWELSKVTREHMDALWQECRGREVTPEYAAVLSAMGVALPVCSER